MPQTKKRRQIPYNHHHTHSECVNTFMLQLHMLWLLKQVVAATTTTATTNVTCGADINLRSLRDIVSCMKKEKHKAPFFFIYFL